MSEQSVIQHIRAFAILWVTPLVWRFSRARQAAALQRFSCVEYDSGWQALRVLPTQNDAELRAELFTTALEEFHHSMMFKKLLSHYSFHAVVPNSSPRLSIWDEEPDIKNFLAAQYVGETSVHNEFEIYEKAAENSEIAKTFREICEDEEKHGRDAYHNLVITIGSESKAKDLIRKVRRAHDWRAVKTALEPIGAVVSRVLLGTLYLIFGLVLTHFAKRRLASP